MERMEKVFWNIVYDVVAGNVWIGIVLGTAVVTIISLYTEDHDMLNFLLRAKVF
jgi:hypothetical protein